MMGKACWLVILIVWMYMVDADDFNSAHKTGENKLHPITCQLLCSRLDIKDFNVKDACQRAPRETAREEVIMITNGSSSIQNWKWDTITMVVTTYFNGISRTALTSCIAHSKGKRYGLRELVPGSYDIEDVLSKKEKSQQDFITMVTRYQKLLVADHMVFDLLLFFHQLQQLPTASQPTAVKNMEDILSATVSAVRSNYDSDVYCVVPWVPPCPETNCTEIRMLLGYCQILLLSPDSYIPAADEQGMCQAQATVPLSKFLYGVDRYVALGAQANVQQSIVAGIPWHGYTYHCDQFSGDTCLVKKDKEGDRCFDGSGRRRHSLSEIHSQIIPKAKVKMDEVTKGIYYKLNDSAQMWFENFTTLFIKYQLVQDLQLRGLSIWYGEDLMVDLSGSNNKYFFGSWDFLTHHVLHKAVYNPVKRTHVYADTVAGIGVGCLLLGTILGVVFTCIALRRKSFRRTNRPFKLDEVDDDFRDDEGL